MGCNVLPPDFFGAGAFFCFFALGGVLERRETSFIETSSSPEFSSSESGFDRFFGAALDFSVVWVSCLGAALGLEVAAAFFGAALD